MSKKNEVAIRKNEESRVELVDDSRIANIPRRKFGIDVSFERDETNKKRLNININIPFNK